MFRMKRRKKWEAAMLEGIQKDDKTTCMDLKCVMAAESVCAHWCCVASAWYTAHDSSGSVFSSSVFKPGWTT